MHKYWDRFIKVIFGIFLLGIGMPMFVLGQQSAEPAQLLDIQHAYARGEINADTAALQQFRLLYEPQIPQIHKCAAPAFMFLHRHRDELSPRVIEKIKAYKTEREKAKSSSPALSYTSPSGKFEVLYDTTGTDSVSVTDNDANGVPDYIDWVAESADSSYRHEVQNIGFKDPIPEGTTYKVYVEHITFGAYGYTETTSGSGPLTVIYVENDFDGFPPNTHPEGDQKGALYATVAHEFKHAIQYAQNRWRSPSGAFDWAEMDATLMEEVVYDDVNDYYNYIKNGLNSSTPYSESIFYAPQRGTPGAYWHVSWMIFYSEFYGNHLWKDVWQLVEQDNYLSIDEGLLESLADSADNFETSFVRNHMWHFASGSRAGANDYGFEEKALYPNANMESTFTGVPIEDIAMNDISPLAARYFEVTPAASDEGFIDVAIDFDSTQVGLGLLFYMKNGEINEAIATGEDKGQVYKPTETSWQDIDKLGIVVANYSNSVKTGNLNLMLGKTGNAITIRDPKYADLPKQIKIYQNYPNPFNPRTNIDFELPRSAFVELEVFDITGRKVQTLTREFYRLGSYSIPFNAAGLSSGIYIYRLRIDEVVLTRKMTLVK